MKLARLRQSINKTTDRRNHNTILRRLKLRDPDAMPDVPRRPRRPKAAKDSAN